MSSTHSSVTLKNMMLEGGFFVFEAENGRMNPQIHPDQGRGIYINNLTIMQILKLSGTKEQDIINQTMSIIKNGGLVVFPTDTVYGLLVDSTNPVAIDKLLAFKDRPAGKAISVFVSDENMANAYIKENPNSANIFKNLLPGPFTIVCNSLHKTDKRLEAENGTLGIRLPDFPLITKLVKQYGKPLTATSANLSGTPPHHSINSLLKSLNFLKNIHNISKGKRVHLIDLIIDAGDLPKNKPSTVIDTTSGSLKTLRFGDLLPNTPNSLLSKSEEETKQLARFILSKAIKNSSGRPIVFLLQGELGTGKTIFTKGLGKILGVKEEVISPTFTICYEYKIGQIVGADQCVHPSGFSTKSSDLSTDQPIVNGVYFDIERQNPNIDYVDQVPFQTTDYRLQTTTKTKKRICSSRKTVDSRLIHYDLYRIETPEDLKEIRFLESIVSGNIYSIEWSERIDEGTLSKLKEIAQIIYIRIKHIDSTTREIEWS